MRLKPRYHEGSPLLLQSEKLNSPWKYITPTWQWENFENMFHLCLSMRRIEASKEGFKMVWHFTLREKSIFSIQENWNSSRSWCQIHIWCWNSVVGTTVQVVTDYEQIVQGSKWEFITDRGSTISSVWFWDETIMYFVRKFSRVHVAALPNKPICKK